MSNAETQHTYAGFWIRFAAFAIDNIGIALILMPFGGMILKADTRLDYGDPAHLRNQLVGILHSTSMLTTTAIVAAIIIGFWIYRSATPGKMLFNAHIVDAKTYRPASTGRLVVRYLGYFVSSFFFGLGFLWIAFDKRKQGWHDKLAGTVVIVGAPESGADDS